MTRFWLYSVDLSRVLYANCLLCLPATFLVFYHFHGFLQTLVLGAQYVLLDINVLQAGDELEPYDLVAI